MSRLTDPAFLTHEQYRDSSNLDARVELHRRFSTNPGGWFPWVFDHLADLPPQARILELGSGHGLLWKTNASRIPAGWVITLSDLSAGMLQDAWRNLVITGRAFKYERIDAQSIPYPDQTFDAVIANHMLYHVPDRPLALREVHRVLKPGGSFLASTFGENDMRELEEWILGANPAYQRPTFGFTLESGAAQLAAVFADLTLLRYPDGLRITEVEPLIAYILSRSSGSQLSEAALSNLRATLAAGLRAQGVLTVTKDPGLFLAKKTEI